MITTAMTLSQIVAPQLPALESGRGRCYHVFDGERWSSCDRAMHHGQDHEQTAGSNLSPVQRPDQVFIAPASSTNISQTVTDYRQTIGELVFANTHDTGTFNAHSPNPFNESFTVPALVHPSFSQEASWSSQSSKTTLWGVQNGNRLPSDNERLPHHVWNWQRLQDLKTAHPLPPAPRTARKSWISVPRYRGMTFYRWLMVLVILANIAVVAGLLGHTRPESSLYYGQAATAVSANLTMAVLMRQEHVINLLFDLACAIPNRTSLGVRRIAAKLAYNNGGMHSGTAISAFIWYIAYAVLVCQQFQGSRTQSQAVLAVTICLIVLFIILILMSHPKIRRKYHDVWERSHRYGGWTAVALVWAQLFLLVVASKGTEHHPLSSRLIRLPSFWLLILITLCLIYPWLRVKRLPVNATKLSDHATQLRFTDRHLPSCRGVRLAHNPLVECHGFATIPDPSTGPSSGAKEKGYRIIISHAGDFTRGMIRSPPSHIWMRGAPTTGVMRLSSLFSPIVIVATGSGIGPCLSFLNVYAGRHDMRVLWSARSPDTTYGAEIVRNVLAADERAVIVDTKGEGMGKVDLVGLTWALVRECKAEAVMCISNPNVTGEVVYRMEAMGVAAFGPVFDS
jgi:hypothetical protein